MILTVSAKRSFDTCPKKFEYRYIRELAPTVESEPLERGSLFHEEAEEAHTIGGERAYADWVKRYDQFVTEAAEIPFVIPFGMVFGSGFESEDLAFGGVIDLVARNKLDNTLWLVDHKSCLRFYPYPDLYATEQLYLYWLAYTSVQGEEKPKGVCLSRVKVQKDVNVKHFNNYLVRYLKDSVSSELTLTKLRRWIKQGLDKSDDLWYNKQLSANKTIKVLLHKRPVSTKHLSTKPKSNGFLKVLNIYADPGSAIAPPGYLLTSIYLSKGTLVHIERKYYIPTPEEIAAVEEDFKSFTRNLLGTSYFRRSPGLHCAQCPFRMPCEASRKGQEEFQEGFPVYETRPASEEVLGALERKPGLTRKESI